MAEPVADELDGEPQPERRRKKKPKRQRRGGVSSYPAAKVWIWTAGLGLFGALAAVIVGAITSFAAVPLLAVTPPIWALAGFFIGSLLHPWDAAGSPLSIVLSVLVLGFRMDDQFTLAVRAFVAVAIGLFCVGFPLFSKLPGNDGLLAPHGGGGAASKATIPEKVRMVFAAMSQQHGADKACLILLRGWPQPGSKNADIQREMAFSQAVMRAIMDAGAAATEGSNIGNDQMAYAIALKEPSIDQFAKRLTLFSDVEVRGQNITARIDPNKIDDIAARGGFKPQP